MSMANGLACDVRVAGQRAILEETAITAKWNVGIACAAGTRPASGTSAARTPKRVCERVLSQHLMQCFGGRGPPFHLRLKDSKVREPFLHIRGFGHVKGIGCLRCAHLCFLPPGA